METNRHVTLSSRYSCTIRARSLPDRLLSMVFVTANDAERVRAMSLHALRDRSIGKISCSEMDGHQHRDRSRVFWTPAQDRALLNLMVDQVRRGGKLGNGFRKDSWKAMLSRFNREFCLRYDVQQLKHRLKYYRNQYRLVKAILDRGFTWNSTSHTLTAPGDLWESYVKENPDAARFKDKRWPYYDDWCKILAHGATIEGQIDTASPLNDLDNEVMMEDSDGGTELRLSATPSGSPCSNRDMAQITNNMCADNSYADLDPESRMNTPRIQRAGQRRNSWKHKATAVHTTPDDIIDAMPVGALLKETPGEDRWPVEKCIEELNSMEALEEDLFLKALLVFRDEYNRRVFLSIKEDRRRGWLRLICG